MKMKHFPRSEFAGTALLTAGLLAAASCTSHITESRPTHAPSVSAAAVPGSQAAYEALPYGPCRSFMATEQSAQRCLDAETHGRIALVDFNANPAYNPAQLAAQTQETLTHATSGLLKMTVDLIPASPAAQAALAKESCVGEEAQFASVIADETMKLASYSYVVALSSVNACTRSGEPADPSKHQGEGGAADPLKYRDADVYPNNAEAISLPSIPAHEILHDFGLGHEGLALEANGTTLDMPPGHTVDLAGAVQQLTDQVYESNFPSPMGDVTASPDDMELSAPQLNKLNWPQQLLGKSPAEQTLLNNSSVAFTCEDALQGRYAAVKLPQPVTFGGFNPTEDKQTFNEIVFTPAAYDVNKQCELADGAAVSLFDTNNNTDVALGSTSSIVGERNPQWTFTVDGARVTLGRTNNDALVVSERN